MTISITPSALTLTPMRVAPAHITPITTAPGPGASPDKSWGELALESYTGISKPQKGNLGVSLLSMATTPLEWWDVGKAAIGLGQAGPTMQVLGGIHVVIGAFSAAQGLFTNVTPEAVTEALKQQNGGRDIEPADARMLAKNINERARINSSISLGNYAASGAAIATGNMAAGLVAIGLKAATLGMAVVAAAQTVKDIADVLKRQPPAPASAQGVQP